MNEFLEKRYFPGLQKYGITKIFSLKSILKFQEYRKLLTIYHSFFNEKKIIFIHIPKAAGSSVGKSLFGTDIIGHFPYYIYESFNKKKFQNYFKFSIVRDPLSRAYSAYTYLQTGGKGKEDKILGNQLKSESKDFNDFVLNILSEDFCKKNIFFTPQTVFLCDDYGTLKVDKVLHVENLDSEFKEMTNMLNLTVSLKNENSQNSQNRNKFVISAEAKEKFFKLYAKDYEVFKYTKN